MILLTSRSIIEISGENRKKFLQGLITNDINKINNENLIYSAMLNSQGRFLYDFFIFENNEKIFIDCELARRDEIIKKLNFYKLGEKIEIKKNDEIKIFCDLSKSISAIIDAKIFNDPRCPSMGKRIYSTLPPSLWEETIYTPSPLWGEGGGEGYHYQRIKNKIPESENDLTYEKSIIIEFAFDKINAIDFQKGCYVGQELTARTYHLGQVRKKIFHAIINDVKTIEKNHKILQNNEEIGIILSSVFYENKLNCLILLKIEEKNFDKEEIYVIINGARNKLTIIN